MTKAKARKKVGKASHPSLTAGTYAARVCSVSKIGKQLHLFLQLDELKANLKPEKIAKPEEGNNKFYVYCSVFRVYTVIGADNIHHAFNKATKLWQKYWTSVTDKEPRFQSSSEFVPVKEFGALIKTLANNENL